MVVGMHSHWLSGIDTVKLRMKKGSKTVSVSCCIVMSGGYEDDRDGGEAVVYTGEGGNDMLHSRAQIGDQHFQRGNLALANNCRLGVPVRCSSARARNKCARWFNQRRRDDALGRAAQLNM